MTKDLYQILEIEKNATDEQIKKAYRKLSLKWHPDKWATKPESEKKQAEEKFKDISRAYQILSDSATRNTYDVYGEEFDNLGFGDSGSSAADEIKREYAEAEAKKQELKKEMLVVQMRSLSILLVIDEFMEHIQITESSLDSSLWSPCSDWKEKIRSLPFEEVDAFREKMIKAIREAEKNRDDVPGNDEITITKNNSVKRIEDLLKSRGIRVEELEPANRNYKEVISNAGNTSEEILDVEERIKDDIIIKELKKRKNDDEEDQQEEIIIDGVKYNYPAKGNDRRGAKSKKGFKQEIKELLTFVNFLKEEQKDNPSPENQQKLEKAEQRLSQLVGNNNNNNNNNQISPLYPIVFVGLLVVGIGFLIHKNNTRKRRKY